PPTFPLSLHDALPIYPTLWVLPQFVTLFSDAGTGKTPSFYFVTGDSLELQRESLGHFVGSLDKVTRVVRSARRSNWKSFSRWRGDRKSTRLNSSHVAI